MVRSTVIPMIKEGRDDSRMFINDSFPSMEDYFAALGPNKSSEKKKSSPN
jgi:hypothetical protein